MTISLKNVFFQIAEKRKKKKKKGGASGVKTFYK